MAQIVIAARAGTEAKTRLAGVMSAPDRAALTEAMLADMLDALAGQIDSVWVVTPTDALAHLAVRHGARVLRQTEPTGLNGAFDLALTFLRERAPYDPVALLVGDLPLLAAGDLEAAISLAGAHDVVLVPAFSDGGTGAIVLRAGVRFDLAFGGDSFRRHVAAARRLRLSTAVVEANSLGLDVDRPEDFRAILTRGPTTRTAAFLRARLRERSDP
jgi:2-phospho-L-lactate guanylyltransferase